MSTEVANKDVENNKEINIKQLKISQDEVKKDQQVKIDVVDKNGLTKSVPTEQTDKKDANQVEPTTDEETKLDRVPNTGHLVEVNGKILHYEKVGTGKIVVLLMPGLMGSSRSDFPEQLEYMDKNKFTLIAWVCLK